MSAQSGNKRPPGATPVPDKTIFAYGGELQRGFIRYVAALTGKPNPRICFLPTAQADNAAYINYWYSSCVGLPLEPYVVRTFINASPEQQTFEEQILSMDAVIVGGGSTLNMLSIWKGQGIDTVLKKAYDKGIVLAGGSAGSMCWFVSGFTDARPKALSLVECLGILPFSHCPHYHSEPKRKPLFQQGMAGGQLRPEAYACDDLSGILFRNGKMEKSVSLDTAHHSYFLSLSGGRVREEQLASELIER